MGSITAGLYARVSTDAQARGNTIASQLAALHERACADAVTIDPHHAYVDEGRGQTVEVIDGATGEVRRAQVFVAVLGASNLTYAEARWTQSLPDWVGCHVGAFASFGWCRPAACLRQP